MPGLDTYDAVVGGFGLKIHRQSLRGPGLLSENFQPRGEPQIEAPVLWESYENGGGFSRRWLPKTYSRASNLHMRTPMIVLPAGAVHQITIPTPISGQGIPVAAMDIYHDHLFVAAGRYCASSLGGTGTWTVSRDFGPDFRAMSMAIWQGKLLVGGRNPNTGQSAGLWSFDGGTWTQSGPAVKELLSPRGVFWVRQSQGASRMIGTRDMGNQAYFYQHIARGLDPLDEANWSAPIPVGEPDFEIRSVIAAPRLVVFGKGDGIYYVDERDYTPNLTPWFRQSYEQHNAEHSIIHNGSAYVSHFQGLHKLPLDNLQLQQTAMPCNPGTGSPTETPVFSGPTALHTDGQGWIAAAYFDGTNASVWYGRDRDELGVSPPGPLVWHGSECDLENEMINCLRVVSINGDPKLWMASQVGGGGSGEIRLRWQSLPMASNPYQDYLWPTSGTRVANGFHEFAESGYLELPAEDWGNGTALKILRRLKVTADNLDTSIGLEVLAALDGGAYASQGLVNESPYWSSIPADDQQSGRSVRLKIAGTGTARTPFVLRAVEASADVIVEQSSVLELPVILARDQPLGAGQPDGRDQDALWYALVTLANSGPVECQVRGIREPFRAKVLPMPQRRIVQDAEGKPYYTVGQLRLAIVTAPFSQAIWDGSTPYDSVFSYQEDD